MAETAAQLTKEFQENIVKSNAAKISAAELYVGASYTSNCHVLTKKRR